MPLALRTAVPLPQTSLATRSATSSCVASVPVLADRMRPSRATRTLAVATTAVIADCTQDNIASIRTLQKLGFTQERTARERLHWRRPRP